MKITAYVASAFSKNHEGGNKAGVVFMTQPLTRTQKMAIAKELGFAETALLISALNILHQKKKSTYVATRQLALSPS